MRARARAKGRAASTPSGGLSTGRLAGVVIGVALGAFVLGYGVTALAFGTAQNPTDVTLVPDVTDMTVQAASRALDDRGLSMEVGDSLPNRDTPEGAILAQSPLPGHEVSPGSEVRVIISTGQPRLEVPDVEAMPLSLATRALEAAGFTVSMEEVSGEGSPGRVIDAVPAVGSPVVLPATVHLRVGGAPPMLTVPPVIGMLEGPARSYLEDSGFGETDVVYEASAFGEAGGVVGQEPAPGESVPAGSAIRLRVTQPDRPNGADGGVRWLISPASEQEDS